MRERLIWSALVVGALVFALQGGEYSTLDIVRQHQYITEQTVRADSLSRLVDSLTRVERLVRTDTATQEKIGREEFGLTRDDEILYRFMQDTTDTVQP